MPEQQDEKMLDRHRDIVGYAAAPSTLQSRSEEGPVYAIGAGGAVQLNFDECSM